MRLDKNDRIVILGLGVTGLSSCRFCSQYSSHITLLDTRDAPPMLAQVRNEFPDTRIHLGEFPKHILDAADWIIASPGIDLHPYQLHDDARVLGDIELFAHYADNSACLLAATDESDAVQRGRVCLQAILYFA